MPVRIGINGFGRIGRALLRAARRPELDLELVAVNVLGSPEALARLLARDSCVFDAELTMARGRMANVIGWYDNELGYASRLAELAASVAAASRP
jgi:glyceraldehyde-3-phosphate dehydrogenase/erythrose-4-phosphate dehydrogenase